MTRRMFIERSLRQIYNSFPADDAQISYNLINVWLQDAIGVAAKQNYKDSISIDGVSYVNNSFYTTFKGIAITKDEQFLWRAILPQIPFGIGAIDGISTGVFKSSDGKISYPLTLMTMNQQSISKGMRVIPNRVVGYPEGKYLFAISTLILSDYTLTVTLVSGGDSTDLDSELTVPADYHPIMVEYLKQQLTFQRNIPVDVQGDGLDAVKTT